MKGNYKAVFVDKDGTLIKDVPYNVNPDLIRLEKGVLEGLEKLSHNDYLIIIISNQSGIAKGLFESSQLCGVRRKITDLLEQRNVFLSGFYYCPHHPEGALEQYSFDCNCRKPKPGMILAAAEDMNIDLENSWMIGDILNDVEAGARAGCKTILINNGNETEWVMNEFRIPFYTATNFSEAAEFILTSEKLN